MDVSPRQMLSVAATLIPFLEHDDAKRTLMGANMQRQAVPLVHPAAPYVGTGMERRAALDSGEVTLAKNAGEVIYADASKIIVKHAGGMDEYHLAKYQRSNQSTCINHRPLVRVGDTVEQGEPLADGPSTDHASSHWARTSPCIHAVGSFNYEDGIVVSERLVAEDLLTTINITRHEIAPATPSSAPRRSLARSRTSPRTCLPTSTRTASSASAPRSALATSWSARSRLRARAL